MCDAAHTIEPTTNARSKQLEGMKAARLAGYNRFIAVEHKRTHTRESERAGLQEPTKYSTSNIRHKDEWKNETYTNIIGRKNENATTMN